MKSIKPIIILIVFIVTIFGCSKEETPTEPKVVYGELEGQVSSEYWVDTLYHRDVIVGAQICLIGEQCIYSEHDGWYGMKNVPVGKYYMTVYSPNYNYYNDYVKIEEGTNYHSIHLTLKQ